MNEVLFFEDDVVKISPQAIKYTPFSAMYKSDRTKDHNRFSDAITLIFFMHSRTSIYRRRTPGIRKNFIANNVFKKDLDFVNKLEKMEGFKEAEAFYIEDQYNEDEWAYEQWKADVEQYIAYLRKVPYSIKKKQNVDGILVDVEIDNSALKMPAVKHFSELIDLGKKIKERVKESAKVVAKGNREKKMFEDPE